jgi:hypothetical protein
VAKTNRKASGKATKANGKTSKATKRAASADRIKAVVDHTPPPMGKAFPITIRKTGKTFSITRRKDGYVVTPRPPHGDGKTVFASPSAAGTAVTGHQENGWRLWYKGAFDRR